MTRRASTPEQVFQALARIRAAVRGAPSGPEWLATVAAFDDALSGYPPATLLEAARCWVRDRPSWPALSELLDEVVAIERRGAVPERPRLPPSRPHAIVIRDPVGMEATIADLRAHPDRYLLAAALANLGDTLLERWRAQRENGA